MNNLHRFLSATLAVTILLLLGVFGLAFVFVLARGAARLFGWA